MAPWQKRKSKIRHSYIFQIYWFSGIRTKRGREKTNFFASWKRIPEKCRLSKNVLRIKNILSKVTKTFELSLHLMDSRTILILFSLLKFHLYYMQVFFALILFWTKFCFKSCIFEPYEFWEKTFEEIFDFLSWRLLEISWNASENINMTGCEVLSRRHCLLWDRKYIWTTGWLTL